MAMKLQNDVRTISKDTFEIKEGTLYVVLKRLENQKLIISLLG